ncbi:MAG: enoyl-CoA hydratase/isomerase family protein [Paucibacter sp.]|nr:enoyl-CoA hydratase/isomerase family protein [Roseateles sp.]
MTPVALISEGQIRADVNGVLGLITLNRPEALNALSLPMIRDMTALLKAWAVDPAIEAIVVLGQGREGKVPAFCAGGDIRFFHKAATAGDGALDDFFTEEYALNHLIHHFPKPYIALMDGITMGGGMGISQGARLRVVSEHSRLAMPETAIGLFPDVGGGWFLAQTPGHIGEFLALTGQVLHAGDAIELGLADVYVPAAQWPAMIEALRQGVQDSAEHVAATVMSLSEVAPEGRIAARQAEIDAHFGKADLQAIAASLSGHEWGEAMGKLSPLMMAVSLEQIRRARGMSLADDLRMERDLVYHCFHGANAQAVEGIRAKAVDKDHAPRWQPASIAEVTPAQVKSFFERPWAPKDHPLATLRAPS